MIIGSLSQGHRCNYACMYVYSISAYAYACMHACMHDGWMDGWMDGRTDGRTDGWMDGWMDVFPDDNKQEILEPKLFNNFNNLHFRKLFRIYEQNL